MDSNLKRSIDTNFHDQWSAFNVNNAVKPVGSIVNHVVYRNEFDNIQQHENESVKEFITRLKTCALDDTHNLTAYHMINRVRSGVINKNLQPNTLTNLQHNSVKHLNKLTVKYLRRVLKVYLKMI